MKNEECKMKNIGAVQWGGLFFCENAIRKLTNVS